MFLDLTFWHTHTKKANLKKNNKNKILESKDLQMPMSTAGINCIIKTVK